MVNIGGAPHDSDDVQDLWYALKEAGFTDSTGENPSISVDDNGGSLTVDSGDGPIDTTVDEFDKSNIQLYSSQFNDLTTVNRTQYINIQSSQGLSILRDVIETRNGGSIVENPQSGEIIVSTDSQPDSFANIESARWGQYTAGYEAQVGVGARLPQQPTEDGDIRWGYFNGDDGFYFGYDSGGLYIGLRRTGVDEVKVYRDNWNGRDPDNVVGVDFNPQDGGIYQINYAWYGYGSIKFSIISSTEGNPQRNVVVHTLSTQGKTSITNPNQPVRMSIDAGASGNAIEAYLGGRQYSILGDIVNNFRITSQTVNGASIDNGSWTHIGSFRRKTSSDRRVNMLMDGFEANADGSVRLALVVNSDVTGQTWVTPDLTSPDETLSEFSSTGTFNGIGNGTKAIESYLDVDQRAKSSVSDPIRELDQPIPRNGPISLLGYGVGGTATVDATLRVREQW